MRKMYSNGLLPIVAMIVAILFIGFAFADVPHLISYQGRLTNSSGVPLTGSHNITFTLYDAAVGGTALWTETHSGVVLNSDGLYNVMLGSVTSFPTSVTFEEQYWLAISVDGGAEICRYELGASPYALNIADTIRQSSGYVMTDGTRRGGIALSGLSLPAGSGSRSATALYGYGNDDVGLYARSNLWEGVIGYSEGDDGIQGVSTSNLYAGVHGINTYSGTVDGYLAFNGYGLYTPDNAYIGDYLQLGGIPSSPAVGEGRIYYNSTDKTAYLWDGSAWQNLVGGSASHDHWGETWSGTGSGLTLNSTGGAGHGLKADISAQSTDGTQWGISGTYSYNAICGISASSQYSAGVYGFCSGAANNSGGVVGALSSIIWAGLGYIDGSGALWAGYFNGNSHFSGGVYADGVSVFNDRVYFSDSVGIGTAAPHNKLEITGTGSGLRFTNLTSASAAGPAGTKVLSVDANGDVILVTDATGGGGGTPGGSDGQIQYNNGGTFGGTNELYYDDASGRLGIGTSSPQVVLDIYGTQNISSSSDGIVNIENTSGWYITFDGDDIQARDGTSSSTLFLNYYGSDVSIARAGLYVEADTNVGIGTITPSAKLDIVGTTFPGPSGWYRGIRTIKSNMVSGDNLSIAIGKESATKNAGSIYFHYYGDASDTNRISLGLHGVNDILNVMGSGNVGIGTTEPTGKLEVVGSIDVGTSDTNGVGIFINTVESVDANAIYSQCANTPGFGLGGDFVGGYIGVMGEATLVGSYDRLGVHGMASGGSGDNYGVWGEAAGNSGTKYGVYGRAEGSGINYAGYFEGDVHVNGTLTKAGGSFLIDHPDDPLHKLLRHNFVESPENLCLYRGKVKLDENGEGIVKMPDYFKSLTKEDEASINLTPVGRPFLTGADWNKDYTAFTVYGEPNREVYWTVYADRDDPVMHKLYHPVVENKGKGTICPYGKLLYPEAYGYPDTMGRDYEITHPKKGHK